MKIIFILYSILIQNTLCYLKVTIPEIDYLDKIDIVIPNFGFIPYNAKISGDLILPEDSNYDGCQDIPRLS